MPGPMGDDEMSLREIARTLADFRAEFRSQLSQLLRTDLYRAEQAAFDARIKALEKDHDAAESAAAANRRLALGAIATGVVTLIVALLMVALVH